MRPVDRQSRPEHPFQNRQTETGEVAFDDVAGTTLLANAGPGRDAAWADIDLDGDLDLFVANYLAANLLLRNDGTSWGEYRRESRYGYDGPVPWRLLG